MQIIGEEVQRSKPEKFADFLLKIRKLLISPGGTLDEKARCGLLHTLESHLLRSVLDLDPCFLSLFLSDLDWQSSVSDYGS